MKKPEFIQFVVLFGVPNEIRTRVTAVKGRCPRPLDDRDVVVNYSDIILVHPKRFELLTLWFVARYSIQLSYGCSNLAEKEGFEPSMRVLARMLP